MTWGRPSCGVIFPLFLLAMVHADEAAACSCILPGIWDPIPAADAEGVPINVAIILPPSFDPTLDYEVLAPDGEAAAVTAERIVSEQGTDLLWILRPTQPLREDTSYSVRHVDTGNEVTRFITGFREIDDLPAIPIAEVEAASSTVRLPGDTCGSESHAASFLLDDIEGAAVVLGARGDVPADFDNSSVGGPINRASLPTDPLIFGSGGCATGWPDATGTAQEIFSFGVLDQAGQFSGWSEGALVELPPTELVPVCSHALALDRQLRGSEAIALSIPFIILWFALRPRRARSTSKYLRPGGEWR